MNQSPIPNPIIQPKRALISVSDKSGVVELATLLSSFGVEILSTGGTAKLLSSAGVSVVQVSDYTGLPEMMDGRLKTLHPRIHGGILARRDVDQEEMGQYEICPIDLVVVNLYPFEKVVSAADATPQLIIENIDIGGPAMIRAAAKNYTWVCVVTSPDDYSIVSDEMRTFGGIRYETRTKLAAATFARTSQYDGLIASYFEQANAPDSVLPENLNLSFRKYMQMRYGENPHQSAAFYVPSQGSKGWLAEAKRHQGKSLSYNNVGDAQAAYDCVKEFDRPSCVIIKHATPCGAASADNLLRAYKSAFATDPTSAFGGVIAINQPLDSDVAKFILDNQFLEVLLAPKITEEALAVLRTKQNVRVLECDLIYGSSLSKVFSKAGGGLLVQDADRQLLNNDGPRVVTDRKPDRDEMADLMFSWKVAKHVKSNAIVYAKNSSTIGIGAGQMSRVDSAMIGVAKAKESGLQVKGSVMASDAFFPFRDGIDTAAKSGVTAVIQPGGSIRDDEVIDAANEHGMTMLFTDMRHFRH